MDLIKKIAWPQVRYILDPIGIFGDDAFNLRIEEAAPDAIKVEQRVELLQAAIEKMLERFPDFELEKAEHVSAFIIETKGQGVIWFRRK